MEIGKYDLFDSIAFVRIELFFLSAILFLIGLILSIPVVRHDIRWLCWYPEKIWNWLKKILEKRPGFFKLFSLIFLLNSTSLFFNLISGFGVVLPILFGVLIGMNVGIIAYKAGGIKAVFSMLIAPNALFELPAAWLSIAAAIRLGLELLVSNSNIRSIFTQSLMIYLYIILPLLLIAALIEAAFIALSIRKLQHPTSLAQKPFDAE